MNTIIYQTIRAGVVLGIALFAFAGEVFAAPTLAPVQANQITKTTVTLVGYVEDTYKTSIVWFEWGESSTLSPMTTVGLVSIYDKGFFQGHLYGLNPDTTYYYRAVAMEGATTVSSPIASFRTGGALMADSSVKTTQALSAGTHVQAKKSTTAKAVVAKKTTTTTSSKSVSSAVTDSSTNSNTATVISAGDGMFPSTLTGWIALLISILIAILIGHMIYEQNENRKKKPIQGEIETAGAVA